MSDNAQGIAEMSGDVEGEGAAVLTRLDAVGNSTKAITKGIAIATAVLAATALFGAFREAVFGAAEGTSAAIDGTIGDIGDSLQYLGVLDVASPSNLIGLIIGAAVVFLFSGTGHQRCFPSRGRRHLRSTTPVPRDPWNHGRNDQAGVRQGRGHRYS